MSAPASSLRRPDGHAPARPLLAVGLMVAAIGFIAIVDTIAKEMTGRLHALQILWGYFFGIAGFVLAWALTGGGFRELVRTRRPGLQAGRAALLVTSIGALFIGLTYIPIADATVISFMAPLFITALSALFLKERVGVHRWTAVLVGLAGVVLIVRPGTGLWHWAAAGPLLGALAFAGYQVATRALAATEQTGTTLLWTALGGLAWISLAQPFVWQPLDARDWLIFAGLGAMGAAAHFCMISAFERAQASLLAPFNYTKLIWVALLGYVVFGEVLGPLTIAGAALIVAAGLYALFRETRARTD